MYEQIFGLTKRPFTSTPFVPNYFPSDAIHHALSQIQMTIDRAAGPVIATGASGTGKSLLLAMLAEHFKQRFQVVNLLCANMVQRSDLLKAILFELNLPYKGLSESDLRLELVEFLKQLPDQSEGILMLVDEVHSVPSEILDEFRLITNFSKNGRASVSLVLAGLPSLEDHLIESKSESLNQRIASRCYLTNLTKSETFDYIVTHLERAGVNGETLFTGDAIIAVHEFSDGCPRVINQVCDYALVLAASQQIDRITADVVTSAWNDVQSIPSTPSTYSISETINAGDDESVTMLEFGQLGGEEDTIEFATIDSDESYEPVESFSSQTVAAEHAPDSIAEPETYCLTFDRETSRQPNTADLQVASELSDFGLDTDQIANGTDQDGQRVQNFEDPFSESFSEEELVANSFVPGVSEHNLNSLMISPAQLEILDELAQQANAIQHAENAEPKEATDGPSDESTETIGQSTTEDADLRMTNEGLLALDQVEQDIKRLQRDLMFTEQQFTSCAVHPDYEYCDDDQPLEEFVQSHTVIDEQLLSNTNQNQEDSAATIQFEQDNTITDTEVFVDDRDMMVIDPSERFRFDIEAETTDDTDQTHRISTGNAERMDYKDLFHQLRTSGQ